MWRRIDICMDVYLFGVYVAYASDGKLPVTIDPLPRILSYEIAIPCASGAQHQTWGRHVRHTRTRINSAHLHIVYIYT